ncbi:hypothetical protein ACFX2B_014492 [Malus domestica]
MVFSSVVGEKSSGNGITELELLFVDQMRSFGAVEMVDQSRRTALLSLQEPLVDNGSSQSKLSVAALARHDG